MFLGFGLTLVVHVFLKYAGIYTDLWWLQPAILTAVSFLVIKRKLTKPKQKPQGPPKIFALQDHTFQESKTIRFQILRTKWTLFLLQFGRIKTLQKKVKLLEEENQQLLREMNGIQGLWMKTPQANSSQIRRTTPDRTPLALPEPQLFSDNFFDAYTIEAKSQSQEMTEKDAD